MQYFYKPGQAVIFCLSLAFSLPAFAVGTNSGTDIVNSVTLDYTVNGGSQPTQSATAAFKVDRKLQLDVTTGDGGWVTVTSGQQSGSGLSRMPAINFAVSNLSNADINAVVGVVDQDLTAINLFPAPPGGATSFDEDAYIVAIDDGTADADNRRFDPDDTVLLPNADGYYDLGLLTEDEVVNVMVVLDVPLGAAAGEYATYSLVAGVASGAAAPIAFDDSNHIAAASGATPVNNVNLLDQVETVFADVASGNSEDVGFDFFIAGGIGGTGAPDQDYDGQSSDTSGFVVTGVDVQVAKYAEVIYDPISLNRYLPDGTLDPALVRPKAIPGSVVMYVVGISNEDGTFAADGIVVTDDLPDNAVGLTEPVDEGNQTPDTINTPGQVTVDVDVSPAVNNITFTLPATMDLDAIYTEDCLGGGVDNGYSADTQAGPDVDTALPEIDVTIGQCLPGQSAFVVYFVTVETDN